MNMPLGSFWLAFLASAIVAWPMLKVLRAIKSRQAISEYAPETHQQKEGTPTMGGLIVLVGLLAPLVWLVFGREAQTGSAQPAALAGALPFVVTVCGLALVGFLDDYVVPRLRPGNRGLGWKPKLLLQLMVATAAAFVVPDWSGSVWWMAVGTLSIVYFANAYNFADGLDGLAGGIALLLAGTFACVSITSAHPVASQSAALAGALIPFLLLNAPPAKVFMGDVGALAIGGLIGLWIVQLAFMTMPVDDLTGMTTGPGLGPGLAALAVTTLLLHAELIPVPLQVLWVKISKRRLFPYTPIHHAFERAGWPETQVTASFLLGQFVLAMAGVTIWVWGVEG